MLIDQIGSDGVELLLNDKGIVQSMIKKGISADLDIVFKNYVANKETATLKYLMMEDVFEKALYDVFINYKSEQILQNILEYIEDQDPNKEICELEAKYFLYPSELCRDFECELTNKQLASIISKRPVEKGDIVPTIMAYGLIHIKDRSIINEFYLANVIYDRDGKPTIPKPPKYLLAYELNDMNGILSDLERLFPDKSLYEIFDVDPIAVIKSAKK